MALGGAFVATVVVLLALTLSPLAPHAFAASAARTITLSALAARSVAYAQDGSVLAVFHSEEDRVLVPIDHVPPHVVRAVLDAEDERFLEHNGVDPRAIVRRPR